MLFFRFSHPRNDVWRDNVRLWEDVASKSPNKARVHNNLGNALIREGQIDKAITHLSRALKIEPGLSEAYNNLGVALSKMGKTEEAIKNYSKAIDIKPNYAEAYHNLGLALAKQGKFDEAIANFNEALRINSAVSFYHSDLANVFFLQGKFKEAIEEYLEAVNLDPNNTKAYSNLGLAYLQQGNTTEAVMYYRKALQINPESLEVMNNLAWILATNDDAGIRNGNKAILLAENACKSTNYNDPMFLDTLAAAYAEVGRFDEAIKTAQKALDLIQSTEQRDIETDIQARLSLYNNHQPFREKSLKMN